jgi:hypothetical protein
MSLSLRDLVQNSSAVQHCVRHPNLDTSESAATWFLPPPPLPLLLLLPVRAARGCTQHPNQTLTHQS